MDGGGYFRGTSVDQDTRFSNKEQKELKKIKFPPEFAEKVDIKKVQLPVIKKWVVKRVTEFLDGLEDEVLVNYVFGLLDEPDLDPKKMQISLTGFLAKDAATFMEELWKLLLESQKSSFGLPPVLIEEKKQQLQMRRDETNRIKEGIEKNRRRQNGPEKRDERMDRERERPRDPRPPRRKPSPPRSKESRENRRSRSKERRFERKSRSPSRENDRHRKRRLSPTRKENSDNRKKPRTNESDADYKPKHEKKHEEKKIEKKSEKKKKFKKPDEPNVHNTVTEIPENQIATKPKEKELTTVTADKEHEERKHKHKDKKHKHHHKHHKHHKHHRKSSRRKKSKEEQDANKIKNNVDLDQGQDQDGHDQTSQLELLEKELREKALKSIGSEKVEKQ